jgi:signal transduction histidine kinase
VADSGIGIAGRAGARFRTVRAGPVSSGLRRFVSAWPWLRVSKLIAAHGGCVVVHSAGAGTGSRFVVTLPLAPTAVASRRARVERETVSA